MKLINNDCILAMKEMQDNSVDSIVTDPPYELGFMGKSWDASGIAFNIEVWQQALRVLKPGGHLLAFSGSRTYHRMAVAIEDAGFEIRDQIMWVYGSGFPKSHNISKGIDKAAGFEGQVIGRGSSWNRPDSVEGDTARMNVSPGEYDIKEFSLAAKQWQGWGTALKPAHEPIVLARKPLIGTVANNVLTHGTGGLNIDGSRVETTDTIPDTTNNNIKSNAYASDTSDRERDTTYSQNPQGRWPANVIHDGSDEVVALFPNSKAPKPYVGKEYDETSMFGIGGVNHDSEYGDSGSAARFFYCAKASKRDRNEGLDGFEIKKNSKMFRTANNTSETISEGFERFDTQPQANNHPTVKPTDLMRYLCRLVTPPAGIVLDPFMGSGSTGKAAMLEGFDFIGIEQSAEYLEIAKARIEFAKNEA
jgi:site-specific DNA-methyltransferase (adenine-specific)